MIVVDISIALQHVSIFVIILEEGEGEGLTVSRVQATRRATMDTSRQLVCFLKSRAKKRSSNIYRERTSGYQSACAHFGLRATLSADESMQTC